MYNSGGECAVQCCITREEQHRQCTFCGTYYYDHEQSARDRLPSTNTYTSTYCTDTTRARQVAVRPTHDNEKRIKFRRSLYVSEKSKKPRALKSRFHCRKRFDHPQSKHPQSAYTRVVNRNGNALTEIVFDVWNWLRTTGTILHDGVPNTHHIYYYSNNNNKLYERDIPMQPTAAWLGRGLRQEVVLCDARDEWIVTAIDDGRRGMMERAERAEGIIPIQKTKLCPHCGGARAPSYGVATGRELNDRTHQAVCVDAV